MNSTNHLTQKSKEELINDLLVLQTESRRINTELKGRDRELQAIYKISSLMENPELSLETVLQEIVELIPPAWQFPKITCARIIFGEHEYKTSNFKISNWQQTEVVHNDKVTNASIEVYYLKKKPYADEGPFLKEERNLLKIIASNLSKIIETKYLINELEDSEEKFSVSYQKSPVAKCLVDKSDNYKLLEVNDAFLSLTGFSREELEDRYLQDINFISKELINTVLIPEIKKNKHIKDFELTVQNRKGENKTGLINIVTITLKSKEVVLVAISDVSEQKKIHDRIIENEKRLQSIFENMQDAYFQVDLDGNFSYINPMAVEMYRYGSEKELLGKPSTILYANDSDRDKLLKILQETGKVTDFSGNAIRKDGTTFIASMNVQFIYDKDGNVAGTEGVVRDITERINSEKEISKLLNRFKQIAKHLPGFIYQLHLKNDGTSQFPYASEGVQEIFGLTSEEVYKDAKRVFDVLHPDDLERITESISESAENMTIWNESFQVILPNGETIWVEGKSTPIKLEDGSVLWHGYIQDITERKKQEDELNKNRKLLKRSQRAGKIGSWEFNAEDKSLVWEEEMYNIFGYNYEDREIENSAFLDDIIHPDDREYLSGIRNQMEKEKRFLDHEYRIIRKDGKVRHVLAMGDVDINSEGNVVRSFGIVQDITERKKQEQELLIKNKILLESQRIAKVGSWEMDLKSLELKWSEEIYRIYEIDDLKKPVFDDFINLVHPNDRKIIQDKLDDIFNTKIFDEFECRIITSSGETKYIFISGEIIFDKTGTPSHLYGIVQDTTRQKLYEEELIRAREKAEENEKKLINAQELAKLGSWELDIDTQTIKFTDSLFKLLHTSIEEMGSYKLPITEYAEKFIHHDDASIVAEETDKAVKTDDPDFTKYLEHRIKYLDGGVGYVGVRYFIIKNELGRTIKTFGVTQDITEKKNAEIEIIKAKEKAEESD